MSLFQHLIADLQDSIATGSATRHDTTLHRVTDLFLRDVDLLTEEQIGIFDTVMGRLVSVIERAARTALAERLADVAKAPPGVVRTLAHDAIEVARPILVRSSRLDERSLVALASAKSVDHRLAIAEREALSEPVTDALLSKGETVVIRKVAANPGAKFSARGAEIAVDKARLDEELQVLLARRVDLPTEAMDQLLRFAEDAARRRLMGTLPGAMRAHVSEIIAESAGRVRRSLGQTLDYAAALDTVGAIELSRSLDEEDLAAFAQNSLLEETICTLAAITGLGLQSAERLFTVADTDLLLVTAKAQGWSWTTLSVLLKLKDPDLLLPHRARRLLETYESLVPETAEKVLRLMKRRERAAS